MIIFLYGEDSFRRKRKYAEIVSEFTAKNGHLGFSEFNCNEIDTFLEAVKNRSIFSPRTFIGLKDVNIAGLSQDILTIFQNTLLSIADSKEVIVLVSSINQELPQNMECLTNPLSKIQEFSDLSKDKLVFFIAKEAAMRDIKLSESDIKTLISSFAGDLWAIESELNKLSSAKMSEWTTPVTAYPSYFELLNILKFGKSRAQKLIALEIILYKLKEDPARVFNGLAYSPPRGVLPELWFTTMADYDVAVKSGNIEYEEALLDFAIR